eukprot:6196599-Alexandrium_andersonii.AAC.1
MGLRRVAGRAGQGGVSRPAASLQQFCSRLLLRPLGCPPAPWPSSAGSSAGPRSSAMAFTPTRAQATETLFLREEALTE